VNKKIPNILTLKQINFIKDNHARMKRQEIADELGVSISTVRRAGAALDLNFFKPLKYNDQDIKKVFDYFRSHSRNETQKKFPELRVKTILEHHKEHKGYIKQRRFTSEEQISCLKFAGLLNFDQISKILNRPNAHAGSIKKFFICRGISSKTINGLFKNKALFITDDCPFVEVKTYRGGRLCLWVDIERHLKKDVDDSIKYAIYTLAAFQRWLWGDDVKEKIIKILGKNRLQDV